MYIMKWVNILTLSSLLGSCGGAPVSTINSPSGVDSGLQPYVNEYYEMLVNYCENNHYNKNAHLISFSQSIDAAHDIGLCTSREGYFTIQIDQPWWNSANEDDRRHLIYHEMSHCYIHAQHLTDPNNYMYPSIQPIHFNDFYPQVEFDIYNYCNLGLINK